MKTACIIQARLASTRLPAKVLLPLPTGRTVLEEVVHRCRQIEGVDDVAVAVPDSDGGRMVGKSLHAAQAAHGARLAVAWPCPFAESDVLTRYAHVAKLTKADCIIRITSDCPLLNPQVCSDMLAFFKAKELDYLSNAWPVREVPHGWDCEIFTRGLLDEANAMSTDADEREHVTKYFQRITTKGAIWKQMEDRSHLRWTLDTLDDYIRIWKIFEEQIAADPSLRAA